MEAVGGPALGDAGGDAGTVGVAGLVWATNLCSPNDNDCVRNQIESTADPIDGTGPLWVHGRINAYDAVTSQPSSGP